VVTPVAPAVKLSGAPKLTVTGDYEQDYMTGDLARDPPGRHAAKMAVMTRKGSAAAVPDTGVDIPPKIDDSFESLVRTSYLTSTNPAVLAGTLRNESVTVEAQNMGRVSVKINFVDLTLEGK
jgi:hypothetical protein